MPDSAVPRPRRQTRVAYRQAYLAEEAVEDTVELFEAPALDGSIEQAPLRTRGRRVKHLEIVRNVGISFRRWNYATKSLYSATGKGVYEVENRVPGSSKIFTVD